MGQAIPVRTGYTAGEVRRFAKRAKDATQARRLLYWPLSGKARMLLLGSQAGHALLRDEQAFRVALSSKPVDGSIDLFD